MDRGRPRVGGVGQGEGVRRAAALPLPLDDVEQSGAQIQALLSAARRRSHHNALPA
ncbi:hypothetical protein ABZ924_17905 [Streptomyces sp. NPDC046876]|uniref:hypothetical protein n=1 Tax=Streptomyces sp. NPDC046876 TaxID=3155616 RepID=UPI0033EB5366